METATCRWRTVRISWSSSVRWVGIQGHDGESHQQQLVLEGHEEGACVPGALQDLQGAAQGGRVQPLVLEEDPWASPGTGWAPGRESRLQALRGHPVARQRLVGRPAVLQDP